MTETTKIGNIEAIFLIVIIMMNHVILNVSKDIIRLSGSASILNIIFVTIIALLIIFLICKVFKYFSGQDILDISEFLGGKILKTIIGILFIFYFLFCASVFIRSFCESVKVIFFPRVPIFYLIILFLFGAVLCNRLGFSSIIKANLVVIPIILFSIIFIFFANINNFNIHRIFPLLGNGVNSTFFSGISNLFAFSGIGALYFIPPHLKDARQFNKIAFTSIIISSIWLLFSIATMLFMFPSVVSVDEILPLYWSSRFIQFGRFFQRLDAVFLLIWIISMTSYLSMVISLITNTFTKISHFKYKYITIYVASIVILILSILPKNYAQIYLLESTVYKYLVIGVIFVISLTVLFLATFKYIKQAKKKGEVIID